MKNIAFNKIMEVGKDDEFLGKYCENCHIATGLCDCTDCEECPNYVDTRQQAEDGGIDTTHELAGGLTEPSY